MKRMGRIFVVAAGFALACSRLLLASPDVGGKAPAVKVAKWVNHDPPALPGGKDADKHAFIIEFWATWCPPCKKSIPHLGELHEKYEKDGLVILSISNEESEKVAGFLKTTKMPYFVGIDDDMMTNNKYMDDVPGIPHAYLVDKSGVIAWSGNPLETASLDEAIKSVLAGTFDLAKAKNDATTKKKYGELLATLQSLFQKKDKEQLFKTLDEMIALRPQELQPYLIKRSLYGEFGMTDKIPELDEQTEKAFENSQEGTVALLSNEIERPLEDRDAPQMLRLAQRAMTLSKSRDPAVLALGARVQSELGLLDAAIETQAAAVDLVTGDDLTRYQKVLDYFKAAKTLAKSAEVSPTN